MKVLFLPMYDNKLSYYGDNPKEVIDWLLKYDSHLVMEPGELADYARGAVLLLNSEAMVTVLEPDKPIIIPHGESAFLFFEATISLGSLTMRYWDNPPRIISPKYSSSYLTA